MAKISSADYLAIVARMVRDAEEGDAMRQRIVKLTAFKNDLLASLEQSQQVLKSQSKQIEELRDELGALRTARREEPALKSVRNVVG